MRVDLDSYREIWLTLTRNKARTFLTGFGIFWGIFMLVLLIGGGQGMKDMLKGVFNNFATNSAIFVCDKTHIPYHGFPKGRNWMMDMKDVRNIKKTLPELDVVSPVLSMYRGQVVYGDKRGGCSVKGVEPDYQKVESPKLKYGRYINEMDIREGRKVCVIGKEIYTDLFTDGVNPCGKMVRLDSTYYKVVGVDVSEGNLNINGTARRAVTIPLSVVQRIYNRGSQADYIAVTGKKGTVMADVLPMIRNIFAKHHEFSPKDEQAVIFVNTQVMLGVVDGLMRGVSFLIWLVGIGTLFAGAIGVSNIMLVTVRERTTEIGIRRAIGATPVNILSQIIFESIFLTLSAGMAGIFLSVMILQMMELGATEDGILKAHFQVHFWTAIGAVLLLSVLGVLAGLMPAARAMSIKPVDAMRDE